MAATPTQQAEGIVLTFVWDDAIESLYDSWHRRVAAAEHVHRRMADRLRRRRLIMGMLVVLATMLLGAGAFASLRETDSRAIATAGIDPDVVLIVVGSISLLAAVLSGVLTFGAHSTRAEGHRITAIRYEALRREMATTLAIPREARDQPDDALNGARQRMDRYARESPPVGERLWGRIEASFDRSPVAPDPSRRAQALVIPDTPSVSGL